MSEFQYRVYSTTPDVLIAAFVWLAHAVSFARSQYAGRYRIYDSLNDEYVTTTQQEAALFAQYVSSNLPEPQPAPAKAVQP